MLYVPHVEKRLPLSKLKTKGSITVMLTRLTIIIIMNVWNSLITTITMLYLNKRKKPRLLIANMNTPSVQSPTAMTMISMIWLLKRRNCRFKNTG